MDPSDMYTLKPIGYMKSVFHFKNGTPRQSSLCENARGILTIDKSVFNNPEHSLDGLQEFSHAWIFFVFHKNNNAHKKAKVKPPRLNGQRVGVFSTRSPYRPNNIGLSLAKIDKIQGASIFFSGIDILDGTPIIDIKPYIPDYDSPLATQASSSSIPILPVSSLELEHISSQPETGVAKIDDIPHCDQLSCVEDAEPDSSGVLSAGEEEYSSSREIFPKEGSGEECRKLNYEKSSSEIQPDSIEEGFYSLSAALDRAGAALKQSSVTCETLQPDFAKELKKNSTDSLSESLAGHDILSAANEDKDSDDDDVLNFLVGDVISRAASDVVAETANEAKTENTELNVDSSPYSQSNYQTETVAEASSLKREVTKNNCDSDFNSAVTAPWLSNPPVSKVQVYISVEAERQLQTFHCQAQDSKYRTQMLTDPEDAKIAITSILQEEPRSVYRRQKCQNSVYFFALDVLHVTCWFDGDTVNVLRVKPVADVPQLQEKGRHSNSNCQLRKKETDYT